MLSGNPIAQTFTLSGTQTAGLQGLFLTQIGVYFKTKSSTIGTYLAVVETDNGIPNVNRRLGSGRMRSSSITTSNDASAETIFTFEHPIMLSSDKTYAFYLNPEGNSPDYNVWVSEVGGKDIITGEQITQQPYAGTLFVSSNGDSWTPVESQDIKFNLYVAKFTSGSGTAVFVNAADEYMSLDLSASGGIYRKTSGVPIAQGDIVYAANSSNLSQILFSNNQAYPVGIVKYIDEVSGVLYLKESNGLFNNTSFRNIRFYRSPDISNTSYITTTYLVANAIISTIDDIYYEAFVPKFTINEPSGTYVKPLFYGTSNTTYYPASTKDTVGVTATNETLFEYPNFQRSIKSYSNEVAIGGFGRKGTATYEIQMVSLNPYQSPVIDLAAKNFNLIHNRINNDYTNENTNYGNALSKYISKTVILDGVSEDFKVWVTGYRPVNTDIKVYVKFINSNSDTESFDSKEWSLLSYLNNTDALYSSPQDKNDYKEYSWGLKAYSSRPSVSNADSAYVAYADSVGDVGNDISPGTLTYYDRSEVKHIGFTTFAIKIVLLSTDNAVYPNMRDVRSVALMI
jgi:hypothetical protein